jgi:integrase
MPITAKNIDTLKLPHGKRDHFFWDDELTGFGLRVIYTGARKFVFRFRLGGKQSIMSLGPAAKDTLQAARKTAGEVAFKVKQGINPLVEKATAIQESQQTFGALVDNFLARFERDWSESYMDEVARVLRDRAAPLHSFPVTRVSQADIVRVLNSVAKECGEVSANRHRSRLHKFFTWVRSQGIKLPEGNPVEFTERRAEKARKRVLTHAELKRIWEAAKPTEDYGAIVRLLMLTGQRRNEIAHLRWSEVKDDRLELNGDRIKNGRDHIVALTDAAFEIIDMQRKGRETVFGATGLAGFSGHGKAKRELDSDIGKMDHWTIHDLRRTMATLMHEELDVQPHIVEAILNHVSGHKAGVAGIYNRATYAQQKREALNLWADHLAGIVAGRKPKVVSLNRNRAA